jgi:archaellum biogenesis ATPase FlaH
MKYDKLNFLDEIDNKSLITLNISDASLEDSKEFTYYDLEQIVMALSKQYSDGIRIICRNTLNSNINDILNLVRTIRALFDDKEIIIISSEALNADEYIANEFKSYITSFYML